MNILSVDFIRKLMIYLSADQHPFKTFNAPTRFNKISSVIGQTGHEYYIHPEVGRYYYFAVESPLLGWKKTNCCHAEKRKIPSTSHHKAG